MTPFSASLDPRRRSPIVRALLGVIATALLTSIGSAQNNLPKRNVFSAGGSSQATTAQPAGPQSSVLEFNGVVRLGNVTLLCLTTLADKRSHWIAVGDAADGIRVVRYDAESSQVVVRYAGSEIPLGLKQRTFDPATLAAYQPTEMPGPLPVAEVANSAPLTTEQKETEARMLVSDLLEIGMIQRKAYQDAQARAATEKRENGATGGDNAEAPSPAPAPTN